MSGAKEKPPTLTREAIRAEVAKRYATRLHMTLIIASSISVGALVTATLMRSGVDTLWLRWLPALLCAYATFFAGVWLWLRMSRYGRFLREAARKDRESLVDGVDVVDALSNLPIPRGGGSVVRGVLRSGGGAFDGGGASASWVGDSVSQAVSAPPGITEGLGEAAGEAVGDAVGGIAGDDGGIVLVIAIALLALVLAILFGAAAFVIWQAPSILGEVVFEVLLGSPLVRGVKAVDAGNWAGALFGATWKPFGLVAAFAMAFAAFAGAAAPEARTAAEVIAKLSAKAAD
ncbi:MAG: hypothetical protein OEX21_13730 [Betaproteobacteria bacterium]|nr:hypothetical protein [Betaproteobacteria bacterium]